jgi:anti-sigma28 factor (negative regulator of flagellin synthesis)
MIISRAEIRSAISAYRTGRRKSDTGSVLFDTADSFDRSEAAAALMGIAHTTSSEPFYRTDLVSALGRRISEGRYFVPSDEIVDALLGRLLMETAQLV